MASDFDFLAYMDSIEEEWQRASESYKGIGDFEKWDDGEYVVIIDEAIPWESASSSKHFIRFTCTGVTGEHTGDTMFYYQSIETVRGMQTAMKDFAALKIPEEEFTDPRNLPDILKRITEDKPICVIRLTTSKDGNYQFMDIVGLADVAEGGGDEGDEDGIDDTTSVSQIEIPPFTKDQAVTFTDEGTTIHATVVGIIPEDGVVVVESGETAYEFGPDEWGELTVEETAPKKTKKKRKARKKA